MKKKKTPLQRYNRLFKFLTLDLSLPTCILMTFIIFLYLFAIFQLFSVLKID